MNRVLRRLPAWPVWVAAAWVAQEALRDRVPYGGFPWGRLAFSQAQSPALGLASVLGAAGVSFAVALSGPCCAGLRFDWCPQGRDRLWTSPTTRDPHHQPGADQSESSRCWPSEYGQWARSSRGPQLVRTPLVPARRRSRWSRAVSWVWPRRNVAASRCPEQSCEQNEGSGGRCAGRQGTAPQLVIWPENSTDIDPLADQLAGAAITDAANDIGVPILVGAVVNNPTVPGTLWNVGIVWNPKAGPSQYYVKRHPVPFGEYLPGRSLLSRFISRFDRVPYDFAGAMNPVCFRSAPQNWPTSFVSRLPTTRSCGTPSLQAGGQSAFKPTMRRTPRRFRGAAQSEQQAAMSQIRAVEHGREVLIAATSGVTAIINPAGDVGCSSARVRAWLSRR